MYTNIKTEAVKLSITIEHDNASARFWEALDVFVDEGYEDTTSRR